MPVLPDIPKKASTIEVEGKVYEVKADDFQLKPQMVGKGQFGCVYEAKHNPSGLVMAVKKIQYTSLSDECGNQQRSLRELEVSMETNSCAFLVGFYCSLFWEGELWICMELMDVSLDSLYKAMKEHGEKLPEPILKRISTAVVNALHHLHNLAIIHRDVKPSNILANRHGQIKLCDFGICGKLRNSLVNSMAVGCKPYMPPERINPEMVEGRETYGIRSDVWSLGITMVELANAEFPYKGHSLLFSQIREVVEGPPPRLPSGSFSPQFEDFIEKCLNKELQTRATYVDLLAHPFIKEPSTMKDEELASYMSSAIDKYIGRIRDLQAQMIYGTKPQ